MKCLTIKTSYRYVYIPYIWTADKHSIYLLVIWEGGKYSTTRTKFAHVKRHIYSNIASSLVQDIQIPLHNRLVYSYGNAETLFHWLDNFGLRRTPFDRVLLDEMLGYVDIHIRRIVLCSCSILVTVVKWKHLYFGNDYPCYMSMFFFIFYYFQYTDVCVNRKLGLN